MKPDDKKGLAAIIVSKMPKAKGGEGADETAAESDAGVDEKDEDIGMESAAGELIAAVKKGDASAVAAAFKDMYSMCD